MREKRTTKLYLKKNDRINQHDYELMKKFSVEAKETYNYCNYIVRQFFFSKKENQEYDFSFVDEYDELKPFF